MESTHIPWKTLKSHVNPWLSFAWTFTSHPAFLTFCPLFPFLPILLGLTLRELWLWVNMLSLRFFTEWEAMFPTREVILCRVHNSVNHMAGRKPGDYLAYLLLFLVNEIRVERNEVIEQWHIRHWEGSWSRFTHSLPWNIKMKHPREDRNNYTMFCPILYCKTKSVYVK